jgi:CRP/FNR family cyclic AMP-dependent transcriptional regulator
MTTVAAKKTILVIEDNEDVRENIAELLELSNYTVLKAANGQFGVEMATKEHPDLIVCDIMMPVIDGYGVLHLLSRNKKTYGIPFIFLTAKSERADFRKSMEMGADDYLIKPFDGVELLNAIEVRLKKCDSIKAGVNEHAVGIERFIDAAKGTGNIQLISDEREVYDYKKKYVIYAEGQKPKAVYYVLRGKVKAYKTNEDGKELITDIFVAGDFLGYNPVLKGMNYADNAQVIEDASVMSIPNEEFIALLTSDTQVMQQFIRLITKNIMEKEETLVNLVYNSLRKKVAYGLVKALDKYKKEGSEQTVLELSRENLAQLVGVATESLIRTLADFKIEKLIDLQAGKVTILDEKRLRELPY